MAQPESVRAVILTTYTKAPSAGRAPAGMGEGTREFPGEPGYSGEQIAAVKASCSLIKTTPADA